MEIVSCDGEDGLLEMSIDGMIVSAIARNVSHCSVLYGRGGPDGVAAGGNRTMVRVRNSGGRRDIVRRRESAVEV